MRILYVEDNPANLFLIKRVAKMGDHDVVNLIDGEEALRKIDMIKPDLILMDIQLAGQLTGLDVVRKLRSTGYTMPIVAVTAYAMVGDRERCLEAGCNEYLSKPLPIGRVVELLQLYQAGVPAPAAPKDDDSATNIPIITRVPTASTPTAAAPAAPETPAAPASSAPAETPAPPADTPAESAAPVDQAAVTTPPADAASVPAPAANSAAPAPAPQSESPAHTSSSASPETPRPADASAMPASSGSDTESHPTIESTSQDTSHPQDTVQAQ